MKKIKVTIEGKTPLLMHRFTDEAQLAATTGSRSSVANDAEEPRAQAEAALYVDEQGRTGIPGPNILRCVIDAGKYFKVGRVKITTQKTSLIPAAFSIEEPFLLLDGSDWKVDTRPVRIPATGGRILRHRPCFDSWKVMFHAGLDESIISRKLMREIVDAAGNRIGLGDFRPDTKGPFGRFVVTNWA